MGPLRMKLVGVHNYGQWQGPALISHIQYAANGRYQMQGAPFRSLLLVASCLCVRVRACFSCCHFGSGKRPTFEVPAQAGTSSLTHPLRLVSSPLSSSLSQAAMATMAEMKEFVNLHVQSDLAYLWNEKGIGHQVSVQLGSAPDHDFGSLRCD